MKLVRESLYEKWSKEEKDDFKYDSSPKNKHHEKEKDDEEEDDEWSEKEKHDFKTGK